MRPVRLMNLSCPDYVRLKLINSIIVKPEKPPGMEK